MITSQNPESTYQGNGVATTFDYTFQVSNPAFIEVTSSASTSPLVLNQDYTVQGVGQSNSSLWTITMAVAPAVGVTITILPNLPILQSISFATQSNFYPQTVEQALDYITLILQQQQLVLGDVSNNAADAATATAAAATATAAATQAQAAAAALSSATTDPYDQTQYGVATGTNTYAVALTPVPTGYTLGMNVVIKFTNANTGAATLNVNALGAISIVYLGAALVAGQIAAGQVAHLTYDGTSFNLLDPATAAETTYPAGTILANLTGAAAAPTGATPIQVNNALDMAEVVVASANSTPIGGAASNYVVISGATNISSFDTVAAGIVRTVRFQGALTLTYSATSMILPGGSNITTAAGDVATFVSEGGGYWRCTGYTTASGLALNTPATNNLVLVQLTASGTWVVPAGVTAAKVTVVGGGGGGAGTGTSTGNNGTAGGSSSIGGVSATGGAGGLWNSTGSWPCAPGVGSGGSVNSAGGISPLPVVGQPTYGALGAFGYGLPGRAAAAGNAASASSGFGAGGASGSAPSGATGVGLGGGGGGGAIGYLTGLTPGNGITFIIGAGGAGGAGASGGGSGGAGAPGVIIIEY